MSDGKATSKELNELHGLIARELARKIRQGEATAAEYAAAIKFLKDNNVQALVTPENPLGKLAVALTDSLPFPSQGMEH